MPYDSQVRATLNDTIKSQENLRSVLDDLEINNKYVGDKERGQFFELLARSLLGFDHDKHCNLKLPDDTILDIGDVGEFIRYLAYYEHSNVDINLLKRYGRYNDTKVRIGDIWHELKFIIFGIFPEALAMSIRISKEQKKSGGSRGHYVGPKNISRFTGETD